MSGEKEKSPPPKQKLAYVVCGKYRPVTTAQQAGYRITGVYPAPGSKPSATWLLMEKK